ncbi:MAG: nucleotidyl transferase AbiEii/AbiGii toxin family protein [Azonexus sp.]|nr:nucleotidyl transferase AbiEii/AbiGii toxin family protein [Azonexus sp.]
MFERLHHRRIASVLSALDGRLLREANCLFGSGTAIALRCGEYRESVDIDFLVSDVASYRSLRKLLIGPAGFAGLLRAGSTAFIQARECRADQYGIRTSLLVADQPIKFEIVLEARIALEVPAASDEVCGIATLSRLDLATSKLLANADRWSDDGVFSRDVIDLAMMRPTLPLLRQVVTKAEQTYGQAICRDLEKAIDKLQTRHGWLERCMQAMAISLPKAVLWERIRALRRVLP